MHRYNLTLTNGTIIVAALAYPELVFGVTAVALHNSHAAFLRNEPVFALHPITQEKLRLVACSGLPSGFEAELLVPAHNAHHFILAAKHGLTIKQVVAPYFKGIDGEAIREDKPTQHRKSVIVVVKHHIQNKYLCVNALKRNCKSFVLGGIEEGETAQDAAKREVAEETGYLNLKIVRTSLFTLHNHFYAEYKGVNRYAHLTVVFAQLVNDETEPLTAEEQAKQEALWLTEQALESFLTVNNNQFVFQRLFHADQAYEGDGIMMQSEHLDNLTREQARQQWLAHS